jgi:thiamine pyrophosphokinase
MLYSWHTDSAGGSEVTGIVVTGGTGPGPETLRQWAQRGDLIIAADTGLERALDCGIEPDHVVGDMDSLRDRGLLDRFPRERVRAFPQDKDDTDTEIALGMLYNEGCDEVVLAGGGGGRLDHLIGILSLFHRDRHPSLWLSGENEVSAVDDTLERRDLQGATVSFFPVGREACRMQSRGLKWPLDGLVWQQGDVGISNVVTKALLEVKMISGRLIMVRAVEESR